MLRGRGAASTGDAAEGRPIGARPWWTWGAIGSLAVLVLSVPQLLRLGSSGPDNYGWYVTSGGRRLVGLILDQAEYLRLVDATAGRAPGNGVAPFTARSLGPWLAGHLGVDAAVALWLVNVACLVAGTFAIARLAHHLRARVPVVVAVWAVSFPVFWYTGKGLVDAAAVGLVPVVLLAAYRRHLVAGLAALAAAVWMKETALVLVPALVAREVLGPGTRPLRVLRSSAWVVVAAAAMATAELPSGGHEITFAPWFPASANSALRFTAMNMARVGGLPQFLLSAAPALVAVAVWLDSRRRGVELLGRADLVPLAVGMATALVLGFYALPTALLDGRTVWTSVPFGALVLGAWAAAAAPAERRRELTSLARRWAPLTVVGLVVWFVIGSVLAGRYLGGPAAQLEDPSPRFAVPPADGTKPRWSTSSGSGDGTVEVPGGGPHLLRFSSADPLRFLLPDGTARPHTGATAGTVMVDEDGPATVRVETDGDWTVTLQPPDSAMFWEALSTVEGSGPTVLVLPGALRRAADVELVSEDPEDTVELVGRCRLGRCGEWDGQVPAGTEAVLVDAAGGWQLVPGGPTAQERARTLPGSTP